MSSSLITACTDMLQRGWIEALTLYRDAHPDRDLILTCTYRSLEEQATLYKQGRSTPGSIVTNVDGVHTLSQHNYTPSRAFDFAVLVGGKVSWAPAEYEVAGAIFTGVGLRWGIHLNPRTIDYPHVQEP